MIIRKIRTTQKQAAALARAGFTLLEILIVVAIIVVLAGVGTFYLLPLLQGSKDDVALAQTKTITEAWGIYEKNNGAPPNLQALTQRQPNGAKAILEPDAIIDPWGKAFQFDASGPMNGGNKVDIWTVSPEGKKLGNWSRYQQ
jgi:general secretion pathway protein G